MLARHRSSGAAVTIALHRVEDARAFGLVATDPAGRITEFREKPPDPIAGDINAGTYVLDPSALRAWNAGTYIWIEGEIFPALIAGGRPMVGFASDAYWLDLGTPEQYLRAHADLLGGKVRGRAYDAPWIGPGASVDPSARVGKAVAIGAGSQDRGRRGGGRGRAPPRIGGGDGRAGPALDRGVRVRRWVRAPPSSDACWATVSGASPGAQLDGVRMSSDSAP